MQPTRRMAAWGLIVMLVIYFDMHISMLMHAERFPSIPLSVLYARIPFQFMFIAWAWAYTRSASGEKSKGPASTRRPLFESYSLVCRVAEWLEEWRAQEFHVVVGHYCSHFLFRGGGGGSGHGAAHFFKKLFETARQADQN